MLPTSMQQHPDAEEPSIETKYSDFDQSTGTLNHSRKQTPTKSEEAFLSSLLEHLRANRFSGAVSIQEFLICPLQKRGVDVAVTKQLKEIERRFQSAKFTIRRPDLLCIKYGFVVEVDGGVHDGSDSRVRRDNTRDAEYALLGLQVFVIANRQVYNPAAKNLVINEILTFIEQEAARPDFKQRYQRRRTAISRARKEYVAANSSLDIGTFERKPSDRVEFPSGIGARQWGGYRFEMKPK